MRRFWPGAAVGGLWVLLGLFVCLVAGSQGARAQDDAKLWAALKQGEAFAIMRHALAPGVGDPENFKLEDCATQRNLSDEGRKQARAIGARFRDNGVHAARVYSSAWCRCKETAELLGLGSVEPLTQLNSSFQDYERRKPQTEALKAWLAEAPLSPPLVLVTHQVNIAALTGQPIRSGEVLVVQRVRGKHVKVLGSLGD